MCSNKIAFRPIGVVRTAFTDTQVKSSIQGVKGSIEVFDDYSNGLTAIEGFSHIIVVAFLNKVVAKQRNVLTVKYRRLLKYGLKREELPEVGVFCSDSPHRPNPIAISIVKLERREGRFLHVQGLDLYNGTPVLDIKHYTPNRIIRALQLPTWYKALEQKIGATTGLSHPPL